MPRGQHRSLHHQAVSACLLHQAGALGGLGGNGRDADRYPSALDRRDSLTDQLLPNRSLVELLQQAVDAVPRRFGDFPKDARRVGITSLQPVEVEHSHPTQPPHLNRKADIDHAVHGRRQDRNRESERPELEGGINLIGVDRHPPRHQGDLVEPVGAASAFEAAELKGVAALEDRGLGGRTHTHGRRLRNRVALKGYAWSSGRVVFGDYNRWPSRWINTFPLRTACAPP